MITHRRAAADISQAHKQDGLGGGRAASSGRRHVQRAAVAGGRSSWESPGVAWDDDGEEAAQQQNQVRGRAAGHLLQEG